MRHNIYNPWLNNTKSKNKEQKRDVSVYSYLSLINCTAIRCTSSNRCNKYCSQSTDSAQNNTVTTNPHYK